MNRALVSSVKQDWQTPDSLLGIIRQFDCIGLDPCTSYDNPVGAKEFFCSMGEREVWAGRGLVYCNPPYSRALPTWAAKIAGEGNVGTEIVALLPARPDTRWWQQNITRAHAICFLRGRLKFRGATTGAPFPSALAYWGPRRGRFCDLFQDHGWLTSATYQVQLPPEGRR